MISSTRSTAPVRECLEQRFQPHEYPSSRIAPLQTIWAMRDGPGAQRKLADEPRTTTLANIPKPEWRKYTVPPGGWLGRGDH